MSEAEVTYDLNLLQQSRAKWRESAALRAVYHNIFRDMAAQCVKGESLELGSGIGVATEVIPDLVTSDLLKTEFVDRAVSAYDIPAENWANILAMDTLHHLQRPFGFFESVSGALRLGGRLVLIEPAGTSWGRFFYRLFHHEPCVPDQIVAPFEFSADANGEFANMGMGVGLFELNSPETGRVLTELGLTVSKVSYRDLFAYPISGGFSQPAFLPAGLLRPLMMLEQLLPQILMKHLGLRMIIVIEKTSELDSVE